MYLLHDVWCGEGSLKCVVPTLFQIASDEAMVVDLLDCSTLLIKKIVGLLHWLYLVENFVS